MKKITRYITSLTTLMVACSSLHATTLAYWRFENNLNDSSGNGFNASSASAGFNYTTNVPGSVIMPGDLANDAAYQRTGGDNTTTTVAQNATFTSLFESSSWTVETFIWLNTGGQETHLNLFSNLASELGVQFRIFRTGLDAQISFANGAGSFNVHNFGTTGLPTETWMHVAWVGTYTPSSGTSIGFYVDGVKVGSNAFAAYSGGKAMTMSSADWRIGGGGNNFNGSFDELRISNTALQPSEFLVAIPEPSTVIWMLFFGGSFLLLRLRRART